MQSAQDPFELDFKGAKINVQRHALTGQVIYRILFADKRQPLIITRALNADAAKFWTSIPEGRQKEAQEIGTLIQEYLTKKNNS